MALLNIDEIMPILYKLIVSDKRPDVSNSPVDIKIIGRGGFGTVFLVNNDTVFKCLKIYDENELNTFNAEWTMWDELSRIPELQKNIPKYIGHHTFYYPGYTTPSTIVYKGRKKIPSCVGAILQKYEPVEPMSSYLYELKSMNRKIPQDKGVQVFDMLIKAFNILHKNGYIHRDIKPGNILIRTDESNPDINEPIIIDIGLTCKAPCSIHSVSGTTGFLPGNYYKPRPKNRTVNNNISNYRENILKPREFPVITNKMKYVSVKGSRALVPTYTAMTDNYALGKTLEAFIQFIDFSDNTSKDRLEQTVYKLKTQVVGELAASVSRREEPTNVFDVSSSASSINTQLNPSSVSGGRRLRNKRTRKRHA